MNAPLPPTARMTVQEFLDWSARQPETERYELVDGRVVAMTRDSVKHNRAKSAVYRALYDAIQSAPVPCEVFIDGVGVRVGERTVRIPDVVVHCGAEPDPDALLIDTPVIVVEVVSPSSEREDRETKLVDYFALPSVAHYLIVAGTQGAVVHHRRTGEATIDTRILRDGEIVLDPPGLTVSVEALLGPAAAPGAKEIN
ncbi:hypothetical protein A33M_4052 [Rhodovulum sp. PH10]|uniref:Uma2 family endonuclease n=1 Tax=Rhodovulum sp. PH10 TaxID=1187851 RepID=UPI00027C26A6|nr:Uma2 family endonuclease [Rhodovulum sp. PH10]EJW10819.1 hypothetical protein A33M_4052 [Rhodovulum sp. PH10]